ncbi:hypothetical protein EON80_21955 [bacterium]|nr:MAG: hypothetical protein EON80_21955 [bacterium]
MLSSRTLHISIDKSYDEVYEFLQQPQNFDKWAAGLATGLHPRPDGTWVAETPLGHLEVTFSSPNGYGVLDHTVYSMTERYTHLDPSYLKAASEALNKLLSFVLSSPLQSRAVTKHNPLNTAA